MRRVWAARLGVCQRRVEHEIVDTAMWSEAGGWGEVDTGAQTSLG